MVQQLESRRYRVTAVLGEGGFGKVYRAQMVTAEGFVKDVAIKLLHDGNVPEETLKRFRDEARILGLVRDRAVVAVEPPTQLGGRWAVVMEFVDGASAKALLELGVFPPGVVCEILREVARALDHVFHMAGPSGEALHLLHRDLKPENLQITRSGDVKILDFGTAKARFENREARTVNHIGGTLGYIAPERLEGIDGAAADVYSLGVMAHVLLTGNKPSRRDDALEPGQLETTYGMLHDLAKQMRSPEPEDRPTARDVEDACARIHRSWEGVSLRAWAERAVSDATRLQKDGMVGHVLSETVAGISLETSLSGLQPLPARRPWLAWVLVAVLLGVLGIVAAGSVGTLSGLGLVVALLWPRAEVLPVQPAPPPVALEVGSVDVPVRIEEEPGQQGTIRRPRPTEPTPAAATWAITFTSVPAGATVYVDGTKIGETPQFDVRIAEGSHSVRMVSDHEATSQRITVGRLKPARYVWKGGSTWLSFSN